jgi:Skp family chaperone for outer membrane proteins
VKKTVAIVLGLATLGAAVYCGNRLAAQAPAPGQVQPAARPLQTRIGLINMFQVLKNYKKFQNLELQIKTRAQQLDDTIKPIREAMEKLKVAYNGGNCAPEKKEEIEREMRKWQLEGTDKEEAARKEMTKMNGDAAVTIYHEVEDAANAYARANNLELVLFYNDAVSKDEYYHPANVKQKLMIPASLMPIVVAPGMDISNALVAYLNSAYNGAPGNTVGTNAPPHAPVPGAPGAPPPH